MTIPRVLSVLATGAFAVLAVGSHAESFVAHVIKIQDGDTLTVLAGQQQIRIRLDGIDAPERAQPFGSRARQSLADICATKMASVDDHGKDRYGRTIGRVTCAGMDANAEQVRRGMAWVFDRYVKTGSPLYALQGQARDAKRGLWADPHAVPPWKWRAMKQQ